MRLALVVMAALALASPAEARPHRHHVRHHAMSAAVRTAIECSIPLLGAGLATPTTSGGAAGTLDFSDPNNSALILLVF